MRENQNDQQLDQAEQNELIINKNFFFLLIGAIAVLLVAVIVLCGLLASKSGNKKDPDTITTVAQTTDPAISVTDVSNTVVTPTVANTIATTVGATASSAYQIGRYSVNTSESDLNLRSLASTDGTIVTTIPKGTILDITQVNGEWGYTSYTQNGSTNTGWVNMTYLLAYVTPTAAPTAPVIITTAAAQ